MVSCKIRGCRNRSDHKGEPKLRFFSFPKNEKVASQWLEVCKRSGVTKNSRVCSSHFASSAYKPKPQHFLDLDFPPIGVRALLDDAVPTENIGIDMVKAQATKRSKVASAATGENVKKKIQPSFIQPKPNVNVPTVLYLKVLDNNTQPHIISSNASSAVKYVTQQPNLDIRLERTEAPAYVLDHQYAAFKTIPNFVYQGIKVNNQSVAKCLPVITRNPTVTKNKPIAKKKPATGNQFVTISSHIVTKNQPLTRGQPVKSNQLVEQNAPIPTGPLIKRTQTSDQDKIKLLTSQLKNKTIENSNLQKQLKRLQKDTKVFVSKRIRDILGSIFSPRQIDKLMNPYKTKIKWSIEDIISAMCLQNLSVKTYRHLRENNYPLPGLSTIRKYTASINLNEGILADVLILMKHKARQLSVFQRIVVLHFGEILANSGLICLARSLFYKWMEPIFYSWEVSRPSADILKEIVSKIYDAGYMVVAITCDLTSLDDQIWADLNIGVRNNRRCYFEHPVVQTDKIFVFPNECQLLGLLRKYFMENGFTVNNKDINIQCIEEMVNVKRQLKDESNRLTIKLLEEFQADELHVSVIKKMFSRAAAQEISYYGEGGFILYRDWEEMSNFFQLIGEWNELFGSKVKEGYKEGEEPYGLCLNQQNGILNRVEELMLITEIEGLEGSTSLQDQVILRCASLRQLLKYLQESFSVDDFQVKYIMTNRLNNELLDYFMAFLCTDEPSDNVTVPNFQSKLRKCVLGRYSCDAGYNQYLKYLEPCLIDFNQRSDSKAVPSDAQKSKTYASGTAQKMRQFLTVNKISTQKVHKNLLHMINKQT